MDFALADRQQFIAEASGRQLTEEEQLQAKHVRLKRKLAAAIASLGDRWVMHPNYRPELNPHHSRHVKTSAILAPVQARAIREGRL